MFENRGATARWMGVLAGLLLAGSAEAATFRFEDGRGVVHYTNVPSDPRYRRLPDWSEPRPSPVRSGRPAVQGRPVTPYAELIRSTSERHRVDHRLVEAVVVAESAGNPHAVSRKGAQGLMQLMPERAAELGVRDPFDPQQNVDGGVRHLRDLLQRFGGDVTLALAAYNAGEDAVRTHQGVPPYPETQDYVRRVRALYDGFDGSALRRALPQAPQRVYREVSSDGTLTYTNVPPHPAPALRRGF